MPESQEAPPATPSGPRSRLGVPKALTRVWPHVLLALGSAVAITLLVTSFLQSSLGLSALDQVQRQSERVDHLDRLHLLLVDAETGVRGYLLTGTPLYLEPYERSVGALEEAARTVRTDFTDMPAQWPQVETLTKLVETKRQIMADAVAKRTLEKVPADDLAGQRVMDEARRHIVELRSQLVDAGQQGIAASIRRFRWTQGIGIFLATSSLGLMVALFAVLQRQFAMRERIAALLAGENARLDEQVRRRTAELSELARYLTRIREVEKARLARELHDELGALLTAAKLDAGSIARKLPPEIRAPMQERLDRLQSTLTQGIALKRRIIDDLQPPLLKDLGLVEALRALVDDIGRGSDLQVVGDLPDEALELELEPERALALYRIAQEAFTNIRKYAGARQARLSLRQDGDWVHLEVADDGCGFDPEHLAADRHGIAGMKHRVQTYAGRLDIISSPGKGTIVRASVPATSSSNGLGGFP